MRNSRALLVSRSKRTFHLSDRFFSPVITDAYTSPWSRKRNQMKRPTFLLLVMLIASFVRGCRETAKREREKREQSRVNPCCGWNMSWTFSSQLVMTNQMKSNLRQKFPEDFSICSTVYSIEKISKFSHSLSLFLWLSLLRWGGCLSHYVR